MSYHWFDRQETMQNEKKNIPKKKLLSIMHKTKKVWKKNQESIIKTCHKKKKTRLKSTKGKKYQELVQYKKEATKNKYFFCSLLSIKNEWKNTEI